MLIFRKVNNNVALAKDDDGTECVIFGLGIGFPAVPYELADRSKITRIYRDVDERFLGAIASLSDSYILASSDIVDLARVELDVELNPNLVFTLADHLQFAQKRQEKGAVLEHPLAEEVSYVYPREYELGKKGLAIVQQRTGSELADTEAVSIALHIVAGESKRPGTASDMDVIIRSATIIEAITGIVEDSFGIVLDRTSFSYMRFVTHLRFLVGRLMRGKREKTQNSALFREAAREFPEAYGCAARIQEYLREGYGWNCTSEEMLYLMMHINRVKQGD